MNYLAENLKYWLWTIARHNHKSEEEYETILIETADACGIPFQRFRNILNEKTDASDAEIQQIKHYFSTFDQEKADFLKYEFLFGGDMEAHKKELISDNIMFLIRTIAWGDNRDLVNTLQINNSTLTRWKSGTMKPSKHFQRELCKYYGIGDVDDLKTAYLFFGLSPVTTPQRKMECKRLIDALDRDGFEAVYPALLKLLK